jgi:hypothetical protein
MQAYAQPLRSTNTRFHRIVRCICSRQQVARLCPLEPGLTTTGIPLRPDMVPRFVRCKPQSGLVMGETGYAGRDPERAFCPRAFAVVLDQPPVPARLRETVSLSGPPPQRLSHAESLDLSRTSPFWLKW